MKKKVSNHKELAEELSKKVQQADEELNGIFEEWRATNDDSQWERYHDLKEARDQWESEARFHEIMMQDKKYATKWLWSDAIAYEVIEEKTDKMIIVRKLEATIKPEAQKALNESFVAGGFFGHFDNGEQEWTFKSNEENPLVTIRKHKDGRWYDSGKMRFTIESKPRHFYDFNF